MTTSEDTLYKESLDFLYSRLPMFSRTGAAAYKPGLETSLRLASFFGNPHKHFKSIHIAGTNGKGSTSHMLASILQSQGYKTGLYTSPHLVDFRERIKINGEMIPKEEVVKFVNNWKGMDYDGHPSFFELTMIMAFDWFARQNVDFAVIETGMGGRLDSTNIINPILSVITNISHDHNQFLGDTLEKIASEKAGIIKEGVPVVIGESQIQTDGVFIRKASETQSPLLFADKENLIENIEETDEGFECSYQRKTFTLPLGGDYQKKNILTLMSAIESLKKLGVKISDSAICDGIENVCKQTGLAGRWMTISKKPLTIADTGHNIGGLEYNFRQLYRLSNSDSFSKVRIIIGFVADKAIDEILKILPRDAVYYITNASIPRALPADRLWEKFISQGIEGRIFRNVKEAYKKAKEEASEKDIIYIGGSTFIVADFLNKD